MQQPDLGADVEDLLPPPREGLIGHLSSNGPLPPRRYHRSAAIAESLDGAIGNGIADPLNTSIRHYFILRRAIEVAAPPKTGKRK
jgi:hypothetical protein